MVIVNTRNSIKNNFNAIIASNSRNKNVYSFSYRKKNIIKFHNLTYI